MCVCREALPEGKGKALPLVAIGTFSGNLQIINPEVHRIEVLLLFVGGQYLLITHKSQREFSISSQPLRCVRWISKHDVITFSCEEQGDTGYYKSYLYHIDLRYCKIAASPSIRCDCNQSNIKDWKSRSNQEGQ